MIVKYLKLKYMNKLSKEPQGNEANTLLPAVFSSDEMISFGNFIRDNYYVAGSPKMLSYHPEKYPHAKVDKIFVYWCLENGITKHRTINLQ
jgi:hypothetical protein